MKIIQDITLLTEIKEICDKIKSTSSTLGKEALLRENEDNEGLKKILEFVFNPFILSGISGKKIAKPVDLNSNMEFIYFQDALEYLKENNTGTNQVIANITFYLQAHTDEMREFLASIITKSLKLGCDVKTINKVYGKGFIPQWEVQQSYSIEKYKLKENEWFSLSEKLNGTRGTYLKGKILSRQGKEISGLEHIIEDIRVLTETLMKGEYVFDGELIRKNTDGLSDNENFRIGTGIINNDDLEKTEIEFIIFDALPACEFESGESAETYKERRETILRIGEIAREKGLQNISAVATIYEGCDTQKIDEALDLMVKNDKEGLMLNRDARYMCKRHNGVLKVKRFYTVDLEIVALEEGSGRLSGMLGAFIVDYKGNTLNVGTGISDELREKYWCEREGLIGRVIEVKYKEESYDKKTLVKSLQFPVFVALREEGKEVSYN